MRTLSSASLPRPPASISTSRPRRCWPVCSPGSVRTRQAARDDADRIVGWRTRPTPGGANDEEALYGAAGLNYSPRQSLFTHVNELALVVGLPPALVERALPFVTVFNGSSDVDAAIAAPEVIAALPDRRGARDVLASGRRCRTTRRQRQMHARPAQATRRQKAPATGSRRRSASSNGRRTPRRS